MKPSEGATSAQAINDAIDARELFGEEAAEAISDFAGLELVPIDEDEEARRLRRAGMTVDQARIVTDFQKGIK